VSLPPLASHCPGVSFRVGPNIPLSINPWRAKSPDHPSNAETFSFGPDCCLRGSRETYIRCNFLPFVDVSVLIFLPLVGRAWNKSFSPYTSIPYGPSPLFFPAFETESVFLSQSFPELPTPAPHLCITFPPMRDMSFLNHRFRLVPTPNLILPGNYPSSYKGFQLLTPYSNFALSPPPPYASCYPYLGDLSSSWIIAFLSTSSSYQGEAIPPSGTLLLL